MSAATTATHPRFRDRRRSVDAEVERQRWARYFTLLTPVLIAIALLAGLRSSLTDVDRVEVSGNVGVAPELIERAARVGLGQQLIDVDIAAVKERIAAIPAVATVDVRRDWPSGIEISVTERIAVAALSGPGANWSLVDIDGTVIEATANPDPTLPQVTLDAGPTAVIPGQVIDIGLAGIVAADAMPDDIANWVESIAVDAAGQGRFQLVGDVDVLFGDQTELADKLVALATVLGRVDRTCLATIDVRVPSAPVVTRAC